MKRFTPSNRRDFLKSAGATAALFTIPGLFAEMLMRTPSMTEGPFYPNKLPLDTDNDLIVINDALTPGVGEITHLSGRILDEAGNPVKNALVKIWQTDSQGIYIHTDAPHREQHDPNFQGFGQFLTGSSGEYYFRTIKPVTYYDDARSGTVTRTPHIHVRIESKGRKDFSTQFFVEGEPFNERDRLLRLIRNDQQRSLIVQPFTPLRTTIPAELEARFDVVLGHTPEL